MQQLYVCKKCNHTWEASFLIMVKQCPRCSSGDILGARYGSGCVCKGKNINVNDKGATNV